MPQELNLRHSKAGHTLWRCIRVFIILHPHDPKTHTRKINLQATTKTKRLETPIKFLDLRKDNYGKVKECRHCI